MRRKLTTKWNIKTIVPSSFGYSLSAFKSTGRRWLTKKNLWNKEKLMWMPKLPQCVRSIFNWLLTKNFNKLNGTRWQQQCTFINSETHSMASWRWNYENTILPCFADLAKLLLVQLQLHLAVMSDLFHWAWNDQCDQERKHTCTCTCILYMHRISLTFLLTVSNNIL